MIEKFAGIVVRHRKAVIFLYLVAAFFSVLGIMNLNVNYDIFSYLPKELSSVKGFRILMDEFNLGNLVQVIIPTSDIKKVKDFISEAEKIKGIQKIDFVTEFVDELTPLEFSNGEIVDNYVKDGYSLVRISFEEPASSPKTEAAYKHLLAVAKKYGAKMAGTVATNYDMKREVQSSLSKFALSAVIFVSIVLLLTLPSFVIPLTFIFAIGISAVINMGLTYLISGELSYFARVIAFPLQFAVTMDYALFLYHRFEEESENLDEEQAMVKSISATFKSVFSAAATTIAGFIALSFMKLGFGKDIGLTLARGVIISLVAIVTLLPALILELRKLIKKLTHKIYVPDFSILGSFSARHSLTLSILAVAFLIISFYFYNSIELSFNFKSGLPETAPSQKASELLAKKFGTKASAYIIYNNVDEKKISNDAEKIKRLDHVANVFGYATVKDPLMPDFLIPSEVKDKFFKNRYTYTMVSFDLDSDDKRLPQVLENLSRTVGENGKIHLTGEVAMLEDLKRVTFLDIDKINIYSILAIFVIIAIAFRSISLPIILVGVIQSAIFFNQGIYALIGKEMTFIGALAIGAIQLGSTVDYAILLTSRFEEELKAGNARLDAIVKAVKESTKPILTSALTMFFATIGMYLFGRIGTIRELGLLISRGAIISFFAVTVFLPALLYLWQPLIRATSISWPKGGGK
ncbi:MAG: MMPL family transporter [Actinobacteria bacterium]|nr:MMPL family transporter [Actinomycetota bacterium]